MFTRRGALIGRAMAAAAAAAIPALPAMAQTADVSALTRQKVSLVAPALCAPTLAHLFDL